jgi:hypothetical protein
MTRSTRVIQRVNCERCAGTGRLKGTRATASHCGTRRGTTLKKRPDWYGRGFRDLVVGRQVFRVEQGSLCS